MECHIEKTKENFMYYTVEEIEVKMHSMAIHRDQMQELCRLRHKDTFDVIYNVSKELGEWAPNLEQR